jgi:hypothetical protein
MRRAAAAVCMVGVTSAQDAGPRLPPYMHRCDFEVVDAALGDDAAFAAGRSAMQQRRPVLLRGAARNMAAMARWTRARLVRVFSGVEFPGHGRGLELVLTGPETWHSDGGDDGIKNDNHDHDHYDSKNDNHELLNYQAFTPYMFRPLNVHGGVDLPSGCSCPLNNKKKNATSFCPLDDIEVPKWFDHWGVGSTQTSVGAGTFFSVGREGSGAGFHAHEEAFCIVAKGSKRWFIQLEDNTKTREYSSSRMLHDNTAEARQRWLAEVFPGLPEDGGIDKPLECMQEAGDILYIPPWAPHAVWNVGETTIALSVTHQKSHAFYEGDARASVPCWKNAWQDHCPDIDE